MDYIELNITVNEADMVDILMAELSELPFDSFVSEKLALKAYIPQNQLVDCKSECDEILAGYGITTARYVQIESQNWNPLKSMTEHLSGLRSTHRIQMWNSRL